MCMCGKPTISGEGQYSWDGKSWFVRKPAPPELEDNEQLLFDEPGRCGGIDAHCHHYRVAGYGPRRTLLVKHGGGTERIQLRSMEKQMDSLLLSLDSNARFWLLNSIYQTVSNHTRDACEAVTNKWVSAIVHKRIKKRKRKGRVSVWIEPDRTNAE